MAAAAVAILVASCAPGASASAPNPRHNIKISPRKLVPCFTQSRSYSRTCKEALIYYLDRARRQTGLSPYRLPADFLRLPASEEVLILSNLDRIAYSLDPIAGLSQSLDQLALQGARDSGDPEFQPSQEFPQSTVYEWGSNWAGGREPLLLAYYFWMYDDGYGSNNLACQAPSDPGCWGHRQNVLLQPEDPRIPLSLSLGVGALGSDYTMLVVAADRTASPVYYYSWEDALADGAGSHVYRVAQPPRSPRGDRSQAARG